MELRNSLAQFAMFQVYAYTERNPISERDPLGTDPLGVGGPIGHALSSHYGAAPCDPYISVIGGGGFMYRGVAGHRGRYGAELLGVGYSVPVTPGGTMEEPSHQERSVPRQTLFTDHSKL